MKGSLRAIVGFLCVFGAVGGMDNATDSQLLVESLVAVLGLAIMYSGVLAMKGNV